MTQQKQVPAEILQKIHKLLRLEEGAKKINSEGEAYAAAMGIQRLLTRYNLSLADIEKEDEKQQVKVGKSADMSYSSEYGNLWKRALMKAVCVNYYCDVFQISGKESMFVVGTDENIVVCKEMYAYLKNAFLRMGRQRYENYAENYAWLISDDTKKSQRLFMSSYLRGAVDGLIRNFESRKVTSQETALAINHSTLIKDYISNTYGRARRSNIRPNTDINMAAYSEGVVDGNNIGLNEQIS